MKKMLAILALMILAAPAMAQTPTNGQLTAETYGVNVKIQVDPSVSMWAGQKDITLVMDGADGNNTAAKADTLTYINNVKADIKVKVQGSLPDSNGPGGGIFFYIFNDQTVTNEAIAKARINDPVAGAYTPNGALVWNQATAAGLGTEQTFTTGLEKANTVKTLSVVYAAASPGENPNVENHNLIVTWTIAPAS